MATKYWIKLYHEILYDRKVASLDDHLWRRVIECFLLAGEINQDGFLPSLDDISWGLRTTEELIEIDLNALIGIGILEFSGGRYFVRKFAERQKAMEKAEYMRRSRGEHQRDEYYEDTLPNSDQSVTSSHVESDTDTDTDTDTDKILTANAVRQPRTKRISGSDTRTYHPSIQAIFRLTGRYPNKTMYDVVIETIGENPDQGKLKECWVEWRRRKFSAINYGWAMDWYVNGIPPVNKYEESERDASKMLEGV